MAWTIPFHIPLISSLTWALSSFWMDCTCIHIIKWLHHCVHTHTHTHTHTNNLSEANGDVERRTDPPDAKVTWVSPMPRLNSLHVYSLKLGSLCSFSRFLSLYIISHLWPQCVLSSILSSFHISSFPFLLVFPVLSIPFQTHKFT